ncbi:MAG: Uncharacterised protein [Owenweeksia sp. TMED14]|nr:MAG: Uncharacterised protein [Owenweeksia sp. TMED14]
MIRDSCSTICERAMRLFQRFGLKAVTMDDISKEMSISKKTLYSFFQNKSDLVDQSIRSKMKSHKNELTAIKKSKKNAIEEILANQSMLIKILEQFGKNFFALRKYYPSTFNWAIQYRKKTIIKSCRENIERGISEGIYKSEIDIEKITLLRYFSLTGIIEDESLLDVPELRTSLLNNSLVMHVEYIATKRGVNYLNDCLELNKNITKPFLE